MIKIGTGKSNDLDSKKAGIEAAKMALEKVGTANLVIIFAPSNYNQEEMLKGVNIIFKKTPLIGCSTFKGIINGEISSDLIIVALNSDVINFEIGISKKIKENPIEAGKNLAQQIKSEDKENSAILMTFFESIGVNGSAIIQGIRENFKKNFPIIGGMASDNSTFTKTYQYYQDQVLTNSLVAVKISGNFSYGIASRHGWEPIGLPAKVTKSEGSVIKEINNCLALDFFKDYFGEKANQLEKPLSEICYMYPLGMSIKGKDEFLIRNAFLSTKEGDIICAGEVPQGSEIRLMIGNPERAISAAKEAAKEVLFKLDKNKPKVVFVFNCIARNKLLGARAKEEILAIQEILGKDIPLIGFYTYGELAPIGITSENNFFSVFHNETIALLALGE